MQKTTMIDKQEYLDRIARFQAWKGAQEASGKTIRQGNRRADQATASG